MYSRVLTASLYGLSGEPTWAEVDSESGMPSFCVVGLANQSIREARERIRSATENSGFDFPVRRITVNLTPANKKKDGSHYDLPIAIGLLISSGLDIGTNCEKISSGKLAFFGELSLDGRINPVEGALPMVLGLKKSGVKEVVIPKDNIRETSLVKDMIFYPAENIAQLVNHLCGNQKIEAVKGKGYAPDESCLDILDFADIKGQESLKRAAQIAAAGMHGMIMVGPPGVGKTMIGKRIPGLLPSLTYDEQLEITQIYSVAGELKKKLPLITQRPFRAPHHSISMAALIGGGGVPRPGEISLAHSGVLFLDELPEFASYTIDALRQPLEDGEVYINRVNSKIVYPAKFMLVAAMNPCRCGYFGDPEKQCKCTESDRLRYIGKVSGPLLDRIDIHVAVERLLYKEIDLCAGAKTTSTAQLKEAVEVAIERQRSRYKDENIKLNSQLNAALISKYCVLSDACSQILKDAYDKWHLSARSYHRLLRLSRTIADLDGAEDIKESHILEALTYRMPDNLSR